MLVLVGDRRRLAESLIVPLTLAPTGGAGRRIRGPIHARGSSGDGLPAREKAADLAHTLVRVSVNACAWLADRPSSCLHGRLHGTTVEGSRRRSPSVFKGGQAVRR